MKFNHRISTTSFLLVLVLMLACSKSDDPEPSPAFTSNVSDVSETGFTVSWSAPAALASVTIEVSEEEGMNPLVYTFTEDQPDVKSHAIEGLHGAKVYYFRLTANFQDGSSFTGVSQAQETSNTSENVMIETPDGMQLAGKLSYLSYLDEQRPAVIFMHELGVWVNNWKGADVVKKFVAEGYVCLVFDFRGHGNSTSIPNLGVLIEDWSLVATDLTAAMAFLKSNPRVDSTNLALAGGSLGAIMSLAGNGFEEVKSTVALSPAKMGVYTLFPDLVPANVCYIVGEHDIHQDPDVNFPEEAQYLYDLSDEPRNLTIVPGTGAHGTELLESTGVEDLIFQWIKSGFEK